MIKNSIFVGMLCVATVQLFSMDRQFFSRENRVVSAYMRSQPMQEEGIVPNRDLVALEEGAVQCESECLERNFFYGLGSIIAFTKYGPPVYAALCL